MFYDFLKDESQTMQHTSIKKNFVMNSLLTLSQIIFPIITFPYVSRVLLPEGTGKVAFASSVVTYFNMFAQLGIPTYGIRACAQCRDNREKLSVVTSELLFLNLFFSLLAIVTFVGSVLLIPRFSEETTLFFVMGTSILFNSIGMEWLYKGLEQYTYITWRSIFFKLISVAFMFLLVRSSNDYVLYGGVSIFAASASNVMNFFHARKYVSFRMRSIYPWRHLKAVLVFFAMSVATTIYTNLDAVMLGFIASDQDVGYYHAAVRIKTILVSFVTSLGAVLLPRASYYIEHEEKEEFLKISTKALYFVLFLALPLMLFFIIFAREGIYFLAGSAFEGAILPMQIIMPTLLFIGLSNILGIQMLVPLGKEKVVLYSEITGAITDFAINLLLIPKYKSAGAAVGTVFAEFIVLMVQGIYLKDLAKSILRDIAIWKMTLASCVAASISLFVKKVGLNSFLTLLLGGIIFFAIYFGLLLWMKEDFAVYIKRQITLRIHRR